jgi:hypothetical protein
MTTVLNTNELNWYLTEPNGEKPFQKYGRFWISNDGILQYRQSNGINIKVNDITVGHLGSKIIVRVNGIVVPTPALEQLRSLLRMYEQTTFKTYSNLLHNIGNHTTSIHRTMY